MNDVVIVAATRTPIGRGHPTKGMFCDLYPHDLLATVYRGVLDQVGLTGDEVDEVITGCVQQVGPQGTNIARNAWLHAGLPTTVPASTVDTQCGASQQAVNLAAALIGSGARDIVLAAGVEQRSRLPFSSGVRIQDEYGDAVTPAMSQRFGLVRSQNLVGQGMAAERIAERWNFSRTELEAWAVRSHGLAGQATQARLFDREITPVATEFDLGTIDQGIRPGTTSASLATLPPAFTGDGRLTAATSSLRYPTALRPFC